MNGLLLIDKPEGISSFGVVSRVRWLLTQELRKQHAISEPNCKCKVKVGHTGTLDPAATGLLVLAVGNYTKKVPELIKQDKAYQVTMTLGKISTTGDKEGDILARSDRVPGLQDILSAINHFTGDIMQTPPAYSAIKINGQRAYDLARKGQVVKLEPRRITVYSNQLTNYSYPIVQFTSEVSSGTYIRSLVEDIGKELETGAYMSDLRRTKIGTYDISDAIKLDNLDAKTVLTRLIDMDPLRHKRLK